jgi:hypothetical protein
MHKLIWGLIIPFAALVVACDDDGPPPAATDEPIEQAAATQSGNGAGEAGQTFSSSQLPVAVTVTAPDGWENPQGGDISDLYAVVDTGIGWVDFLQPTQVYTYSTETQSELGGPPADYVAWFNEIPFATIGTTADVTVGGLQGTRLEVSNLDNEPFALFKMSEGWDYDLSYGDHLHVYILNVDSTQILISCGPESTADFAEFSQMCEAVLETAEFGT